MVLSSGQILNDRYRIERPLGEGGFGSVYLAWDANLDHWVAIKESRDLAAAAERQFRSEAHLLFRLHHSNLPRVHDCFSVPHQGTYLTMDYIEGESLDQKLARLRAPLDPVQVLEWIRPICDALEYLHRQTPPVIHRDIKPANIIISRDGVPYLVDFGISKLFDPNRQTSIGARALTPGYAPPEQYGGASTDRRSDIYALGATIYHLLSGKPMPPAMDITAGIVNPPDPPHLLNPSLSEGFSLAVMRAVRLRRDERWDSAGEFKRALIDSLSDMVQGTQAATANTPAAARTHVARTQPAATQLISNGTDVIPEQISKTLAPTDPRRIWIIGVVGMGLLLILLPFLINRAGAQPTAITLTPTEITSAVGVAPRLTEPPLAVVPVSPDPQITDTPPAWIGTAPIHAGNAAQITELAQWGKGTLEDAVFSPDGQQLAVASSLGIYFYNSETLEQEGYIETEDEADCLAYSPDGRLLAACLSHDVLTIWTTAGRKLLHTIRGQSSDVGMAVFSPDGKVLATAAGEDIRVYSTDDWTLSHTLDAHYERVNDLAFSPDGKTLVSTAYDDMIRLWNLTDGSTKKAIHLKKETGTAYCVDVSPNGDLMAVGLSDKSIRFIRLTDYQQVRVLQGHHSGVQDVRFSGDGKSLASSGGNDKTVRVWRVEDGGLQHTINEFSDYVQKVIYKPVDDVIAVIGNASTVWLGSASDGKQIALLDRHTESLSSLSFSPDGKVLASGTRDGGLIMHRLSDSNRYWAQEGLNSDVTIAFSPDGNSLATSGAAWDAGLWRIDDGDLIRTYGDGKFSIDSLAFSPDGSILAGGTSDGPVALWHVENGVLINTLEGHTRNVEAAAFSPSGEMLATGSWDDTIRLWNISTGSMLLTLDAETEVHSLAFSPDGTSLAAGLSDHTVKLWRIPGGELLQTLEGASADIYSVAFSPDGELVAAASYDRSVRLWRTAGGAALMTLVGHKSAVSGVVFSPDGYLLATGSWDGTIRLWGIP